MTALKKKQAVKQVKNDKITKKMSMKIKDKEERYFCYCTTKKNRKKR